MERFPRRLARYLRARWLSPRRVRFWLVALVAAYTLFGFFALPWIVRYAAVTTAERELGRELAIEAVHTNPYALTLQIDGLALADTDGEQLAGWDRLLVDFTLASVVDRAWTFERIGVDGLVVREERFVSGETRFTRMVGELSGGPAPQSDAEPASLPAVRIRELRVEDAALTFVDNLPDAAPAGTQTSTGVTLGLRDLVLTLEDFSLTQGARFPARLRASVEGGGALAFDGALQVLPDFALDGEARVEDLALAQAEPYLRQFARVAIDGGALSLAGRMRIDAGEPFAFRGPVGVDALRITARSDREPVLGWRSLATEELDLRLGAGRLETAPVTVDGLSARVVIDEDGATNLGELMVADAATGNDRGGDAGPAGEAQPPLSIAIEGVELTGASLEFADHSLPLPFVTRVHTLGGRVSALSSDSTEPARVDLEGQVSDYGLARIGGAVHAWDPMRDTSLRLTFRNLQIPAYSPYTALFAGRRIAGGTMDLDLDYTVQESRLQGRNKLVLRDLELGEKMAVPGAMDVPLGLAIALLKDRNGVIDLDVPVTGDVGDPRFDIGRVIRQALGKVVTSVVQSPFRFLAGLVGAGSEDLGRVEFLPGRSDLTPPQRERVAKLRQALHQRPELVLELAGPFDPGLDRPVIQRGKAVQALRRRLAENGEEIAEPSLTAESTRKAVENLLQELHPEVDLDAVRERFREAEDDSPEGASFDGLAYRNHLAERVIAAQPVTAADLDTLGKARASAVRDALVGADADRAVDAGRVRLVDSVEVDPGDGERIPMAIGLTAD